MWGGVKARGHHGDVFRSWGGGQPLEPLRRRLYREPRPWHLAWALHRHRHLLPDRHCARLLAWGTTVVALERRRTARRQAYRYTHQAFQVMVHSHKVGEETYREFFRLCAVGRDLTSAFRWQQYLVETGELSPISHYTWLLHIASLSPSDESAEDMVEAVWETYLARYCSQVKHSVTGETKFAHYQPSNDDEAKQLEKLFKAFKNLRPKIINGAKPELLEFIDALPEVKNLEDSYSSIWPTVSRHHTFPHLEAGIPWNPPTISHPHLRDSILNEKFVSDLKSAAFSHNVKRVVALVQEYRERVAEEKEKTSAKKYLAGERDIWRDFSDPSSLAFRTSLIEDGGVTAELYHYLIVSMSITQPSVALRTLRRMQESKLRVLDVTRAVMIVRCEGSPKEQLQLFQEQLEEIKERQKIEEDYDVTREVELYWKFCYAEFFYYRNALDRTDFYRMLMEGLGPRKVQQLILDAQVYGTCSFEDITVLDESFRNTTAMYYRHFIGEEVNKALDEITRHIPKLDISLVGSIQHFSDYALPMGDFIATDISTLREKLLGFSNICILDSSFVETSEYFLTVGKTINASNSSDGSSGSTLVLVPYCCLQQLATTIEEGKDDISFDPALQEANKSEPFIASQRLRSLFALLGNTEINVKARILHFSESLLSHAMSETTLKMTTLNPAKSDNDHLLLIVAMIRAISDKDSNVVLCTDDPSLVKQLESGKLNSLFSGKICVISSEPPKNIVQKEENLINDNPEMCISTEFQPKLQFSKAISTDIPSKISVMPSSVKTLTEDTEAIGSAWLDMLNEENEGEKEKQKGIHSSTTNLTNNQNEIKREEKDMVTVPNKDEEKIALEYEKLMNLYDSEHAVAPVGVLMAKASSLGTVFDQFDTTGPDTEMDQAMSAPAPQREPGQEKEKSRRRSPLEKEDLRNRGASNKERFRLARRLGNVSGGRVPFNLRYRILEVDITDERSKYYKEAYREGLEKKRASFKRKFQSSYLVGSAPE